MTRSNGWRQPPTHTAAEGPAKTHTKHTHNTHTHRAEDCRAYQDAASQGDSARFKPLTDDLEMKLLDH